MKFSRNNRSTLQIPKEGYHSATIVDWKEGTPRNTIIGLTSSVLFTFDLGEGLRVVQSMLNFAGPTSLVEKLVDATVGLSDEDVHFDDLIGKTCRVDIKHNHFGGNAYPNVIDVFAEYSF